MRLFLPGENRYFELPSGCRLEVGRQEGCAIRLQDKRVSRRHAEITEENGKIFVQDLGSHAGTWKNGARIEERTELSAGDELKIGEFLFLLETDREKAAPAPSPAAEAAPAAEADHETRHSLPLYEEQAEQQKLFTESMMVLSKKVQNRVLEIL